MGGHLFIVHGDLRMLSCDAWLMPCDVRARPLKQWTAWPPDNTQWPPGTRLEMSSLPTGWDADGVRVARVEAWPADQPRPWLCIVGSGGREIRWYVQGAIDFVEAAAAEQERARRPPRHRRARPLLALPIVGTGYGGAQGSAGDVLRELVPALMASVARRDVDVALLAFDAPAFAAAQVERARQPDVWTALTVEEREEGTRLAELAQRGQLVLFLGAGVSVGAGLPLWDHLLEELAAEASMTADEIAALRRFDPLDRARIIDGRLGGHRINEAVARRFRRHHHSLTHALLAALPVEEAITTNYDQLFELASGAVGATVAVLPHAPRLDATRWLLKMHGCITRPDDIVLTREDFLRYAERRAALSGIVQALLITKHMLFIGFSLSDDNFHRIADAVRRAIRTSSASEPVVEVERFGTALVLVRDRLVQELWKEDLRWIGMIDRDSDEGTAQAARRLEIFLDHLLARATTATSHLLDHRYDGVLTDDERALRQALERFLTKLPREARRAHAWSTVEEALRRLGHRS